MGAPTMVMIDEGMKNDLGELADTTLDLFVKNIVHLDSQGDTAHLLEIVHLLKSQPVVVVAVR